jgi:D-alanyl-D-alanine carboxypeptidase
MLTAAIALCPIGGALPALAQTPAARACPADVAWAGPAPRAAFVDFPAGVPLTSQAAMPAEVEEKLQDRFALLLKNSNAQAGLITIWRPGLGYWSSTRGAKSDAPFWMASYGKLLTSTVILQLAEEGKISLIDPVSRWFPGLPNAASITIDHLLTHTSGLWSFNADLNFRNSGRMWTQDELIAYGAGRPAQFCPGERWDYSNTGYLMLGRIAELVEGEPLEAIVDRRVSRRLGISSFRLIDAQTDFTPSTDENATPLTEVVSIRGAGGFAGSTADMLAVLYGWLGGALVSQPSRDAALARSHEMFGGPTSYGRGVMIYDVPDPQVPTVWVGHSGGAPGAGAIAVYDARRKTYVAVAINVQGPVEAIVNDMLKTLDQAAPPA